MPLPTLNKLPPDPQFNDLVRKINSLVGELTNLLLNLDDVNFDKITANVINVNQLSAISADLGTITAGIIRGIQMYSSYIATRDGTFPRAEMSDTLNMFRGMLSPTQWAGVEAFNSSTGSPTFSWVNGSSEASADISGGMYNIATNSNMSLSAVNNINITSGGNITIGLIGIIEILNWAKLNNSSTGRNLQTEINDIYAAISTKANAFSGLTTSFETGDGRVAMFSNGILVGLA